MNKRCVVLIPIYKDNLDADEFFSVKASLRHLDDFDVLFIGPELLNIQYYSKEFPNVPFHRVQAIAAIGDVGGADVLGRGDEIFDPDG